MTESHEVTLRQLKYLTDEVERQDDSPRAVYAFARAYIHARDFMRDVQSGSNWYWNITPEEVRILAGYVAGNDGYLEPLDFRTYPVIISGVVLGYDTIVDNLETLLRAVGGRQLNDDEILQAYKQFEEIHPFPDGNGRVGSLMYNLWRGTIQEPLATPNLFA